MNLETANYQALIADRDAAIARAEVAEADNAAMLSMLKTIEEGAHDKTHTMGCLSAFRRWPEHPGQSLLERLQASEQYKTMFNHALDCVDRAFQTDSSKPPPILPDFLGLGQDKFKGVVKLAEAYKSLLKDLERLKVLERFYQACARADKFAMSRERFAESIARAFNYATVELEKLGGAE